MTKKINEIHMIIDSVVFFRAYASYYNISTRKISTEVGLKLESVFSQMPVFKYVLFSSDVPDFEAFIIEEINEKPRD